MSTQVWIGRRPTGYEAEALRQLQTRLMSADVHCHLMANFVVDGTEIDLFAVKPDGLFLVELKKVHGPVTGAVNGAWTVQGDDDSHQLNGGRGKNPYQQMTGQFYALANWLEAHKRDFLSEYAAAITWFWADRDDPEAGPRVDIRSLLTFYPDLSGGSELELDWKVEAIGFPELAQILATQDSQRANFTAEEIARLPEALSLRPWTGLELTMRPVVIGASADLSLAAALGTALRDCWHYLQLTAFDVTIRRLVRRRNRAHRALTDPETVLRTRGSLHHRSNLRGGGPARTTPVVDQLGASV